MSYTFEHYEDRKIDFQHLIEVDDWEVKVYTITNRDTFESSVVLENIVTKLPEWLQNAKRSKIPTHKAAFLIVHEAREGVLTLLNWWTGGEMIQTEVRFTDLEAPEELISSPYHPSALVCIWELEVFAHERRSWIENILRKPANPDLNAYFNDVMVK